METWAYTYSMLLRYLSTLLGRFFRSLRSLSSSVSDWDNTTAEVFMRECVCVCADNFSPRVISKTSTCEEQASHINTGEQEAISNKVNIGLAYETHLLILS